MGDTRMAEIKLTGIWQAAKETQEAKHEVNRPGYQGRKAATTSTRTTKTTK